MFFPLCSLFRAAPTPRCFYFCLLLLFSSWEILWISLTLTTQLCKRNTSFAEISRPADFITYWTYRLNQFLNIENQKNPTHPVNGRPGHPSNGCKNLVENAENALMQSREFPNDEVSHVKSWESGVLTQSALTLSISYFETHQLNSNAALYIYTSIKSIIKLLFSMLTASQELLFSALKTTCAWKRSICMCVSHVTDRISFSTNLAKGIVIVERSTNTCKYPALLPYLQSSILFVCKTSPLCDNAASAASMTATAGVSEGK